MPRPRRALFSLGLLLFIALLGLTVSSATSQEPTGYWHEARIIKASDLNLSQIEGLAYEPVAGRFLVFGRVSSASAAPMSVTRVNPAGDVLGSSPTSLPASALLKSTIDPATGVLLLLDSDVTPTGELPVRTLPGDVFGVTNPRGMTIDSDHARLFVLDAGVLVVVPLDAVIDDPGGAADTADAIRHLPIDRAATGSLRGIAYNPYNDHLYIGAPDHNRVYELTTGGRLVAELDLADLELSDMRNLVIAPSGDTTDSPGVMSLYVIDQSLAGGGVDRIIELYLVDERPAVSPTMVIASTQIWVTQTSSWSTPSPDPSGVDYSPQLKRLVIGDGEVEEMPIFRQKNLFLAKTSGVLKQGCDLTGFTTEPVGVAVNPANGTMYISDDNADSVFEIRLGPDSKLCTGDDIRSSFSTRPFNDFDPEGVAFGQGQIFVTDGAGAEVNVISAGANGVFDGLPPAGDDVLSDHFDTMGLGIRDPEGIGYHTQRGTLFLVSRLERKFLFEVSLAGDLLNVIDTAAADIVFPAGIGVGPSSQDSGETSIYIVDRGVDNGQDPNENDGRLFEIALGAEAAPSGSPIYLSHAADTSTAFSGLPETADEDILYSDGTGWTVFFDGSDVGLAGTDLNAFAVVDTGTILMSFMQPVTLAGVGKVDDSDIVQFNAVSLGNNTAGTFTLYFDGSDVGLTKASEDIDALDLLPDGRLIVSTVGSYAVIGAQGKGDDLLSFTPAGLGATTSGTWSLYFDGSDVGIKPATNVDGVDVAANGDIFLTTSENVSLAGLTIGDEDVAHCTPVSLGAATNCTFTSTLYFDGSNWGVAADDIDAIQIP